MDETRPLLGSTGGKDKVSTYFWFCILVSAVGAFVFGFSLGYSSPTMAANIPGQPKTQCCIADSTFNGECQRPNETDSLYAWEDLGSAAGATPTRKRNPDNIGMLNCDLWLDARLEGWFGSVVCLGCLVGALCGGKFVDYVGKKNGMLTAFLFYAVGWLFVAFAPKAEDVTEFNQEKVNVMLITSRVIIGMGIGIVCCSVSNYQTEIATTEIRGTIGTVFQLAITVGLVAAYAIGTVLKNWRTLSYIMVATSVFGFVLTFILVETPTYFMLKGDKPSALKAQKRLRTADSDVLSAINTLEAASTHATAPPFAVVSRAFHTPGKQPGTMLTWTFAPLYCNCHPLSGPRRLL